MRDTLPKRGFWKRESAIVNLDTSGNPGTHWVCYRKLDNNVYYFDSFGNLRPPLELVKYFRGRNLFYNKGVYQTVESSDCGLLCLSFLLDNDLSEWYGGDPEHRHVSTPGP